MDYVVSLFVTNLTKALLLTVVVEAIAMYLQKEKKLELFLILILLNIITNVSLNIIISIIPPNHYDIIVLGLEIVIIVIEACVYFLILREFKRAFRISLICNVSSYIIGILLMPYLY